MSARVESLKTWESPVQLEPNELAAAWQDYRCTRDREMRNRLMEHYLPNVKYYCEWFHSRLPSEVALDDVISAGIDGLRAAVDSFDPERGVKFETYCTLRLRGGILDFLRSNDWVPRLVRRQAATLMHTREDLTATLGRTPTDEEMAGTMGVSPTDLHAMSTTAEAVRIGSLDACCHRDESGREFHVSDTLSDARTEAPGARAQSEALRELITRGLSSDESRVLMMYYYEEMTMKEIGVVLGMSESRVSQIHTGLIERLKSRLAGRSDEFAPMQ